MSKKILITGGSGSLGTALIKRWSDQGHQITALFRTPEKQNHLLKINPHIKIILSDICSEIEVLRACKGQDILIHAAALKQVDLGEYHPIEFFRVNIQGTLNVANAWQQTGGQRPAILISTDKAVSSLNLYGGTKKVAESIFRKFDYSVLRYGNVVTSAGSFIHKWKGLSSVNLRWAEERGQTPTRFCLTFDEAIDLVEDVLRILNSPPYTNGIFVPHSLKSFDLEDVAKALNLYYTKNPLLPYEKIHEELLEQGVGATRETALISRVYAPGWGQDYKNFVSNTAPKMEMEKLVNIIQEEWNNA